ncbi:hypothetical protein JYU34_016881 [Plutella xylostella]|uniref:Vitamin K-dependent gamma-carboxylase n=1 Tax=Plutella xylostella TaxID=51655 RepID=A0ABQ7Q3P7_PLUXY|nr:hypothetical protein JYU34_016881 [Plutella xylostella]
MKKLRDKLTAFCEDFEKKLLSHFGFGFQDVRFDKIVELMHSPRDASSLAVTRILFGLAMLFDIPDERGGASMDRRWGEPRTCHFPLLPTVRALPMPYMALVYAAMWIGAAGLMLGWRFRRCSIMFAACYWYLLLVEKSYWNNHSYLFGLVALLLVGSNANCYWSLDAYFDRRQSRTTVPYWNYFVLKYQFFILYFVAGLKKGTAEWLTGYSLPNLGEHWVFTPFKLFLSVSQIDYLVVHWFAFLFDLTVVFWLSWPRTRRVAAVFCAAFHLMNIRLFRIGMFPWVCLATLPLYYPYDWPKRVLKKLQNIYIKFFKREDDYVCNDDAAAVNNTDDETTPNDDKDQDDNEKSEAQDQSESEDKGQIEDGIEKCDSKKKRTVYFIILYMALQAFLPYSHFLTKGYNNWTSGLYGYSWDMMVHTWETNSVVVRVVDNDKQTQFFLDPYIWAPNDRWTRHGDMVYQYAHCIKRNLLQLNEELNFNDQLSTNISIYIDVWCSMNGRFQQRMFDPKVDLLRASWWPFQAVDWLMPLLSDATSLRGTLDEIREEVHGWSNHSDVIFVADFPGYELENYLPEDLTNVTLTVLGGRVAYQPEVDNHHGQSFLLHADDHMLVAPGTFHKVMNVGRDPAYYMYTFINGTEAGSPRKEVKPATYLPITKEFARRLAGMRTFFQLVLQSIFQLFFRLPVSIMNV